jgi:lysophospholipase L1-like esterase
MMKKLLGSLIITALAMTSCASSGGAGGSKAKTAAAKTPAEQTYDAMIARSLITTGNNLRLKAAIAKAKKGEDVTIVTLGGSITEGSLASVPAKSYAALFTADFARDFAHDPSKIHLVNAGMGGTPSDLGLIRYPFEVTDRAPTPPDIVVIEFAVNDGDDVVNVGRGNEPSGSEAGFAEWVLPNVKV